MECAVVETVTTGPYGIQFTNKNRDMGLPGHSHFAEVTLEFLSLPPDPTKTLLRNPPKQGFPVFQCTAEPIQRRLAAVVAKPIIGTNEEVARQIFAAFDGWTCPEAENFGGEWRLNAVILSVQGVLDAIGHSYSRGVYTVRRQ
jgi:hypothetical protein